MSHASGVLTKIRDGRKVCKVLLPTSETTGYRTRMSRQEIQATLQDVLITEELHRRPSREPDHAAENRALVALAEAMGGSESILECLVETAMALCHSDSAGVSILEPGGEKGIFRWKATAGDYAAHVNSTMPREASPCGTVLDREGILLFRKPERFFRALAGTEPHVVEALLAPFYSDANVVGTLWVISHTDRRLFDAEDSRLMRSLTRFASAAYRLAEAREMAVANRELGQQISAREFELARSNEALRREVDERAHAEAALRASQQRLRLALDSARLGTWSIDLTTGIPEIDEGFKELFGLQSVPSASLAETIESRIHPEDLELLYSMIAEAILSEGSDNYWVEHRAFREDGSLMHLVTTARVFFDGDEDWPEPVRVVGTVLDDTERKRHEEALRESEERMRRAFDIDEVGIIFFKTDGSITRANNAFLRMSGYSQEEVLNGIVRWDVMTPPEWMPQSMTAISEFERFGHTVPYVKEYIRKDGSRWWGLFAAARVSDEEGVEYILDISESKLTEERLRASEERFRAMVSQTTVGVAQADLCGNLTFANERLAAMFGYAGAQELTGRTLLELTHPGHHEESLQLFRRLIADGAPFQFETRYVHADGETRWAIASASPMYDSEGHVQAAVVLAIDITDRKRAEQALRESERHLAGRVDEATGELRALSRRLLRVQEAERRHLARELHDEIGQALTGLSFSLEMARRKRDDEHLKHAMELSEALSEQVSALTLELRPPVLDGMGLIPALLALGERFPSQTGVKVALYHEGADRRFPSDVETAAYRIVQEALTNVARHAGVEAATVRVIASENLSLWISDSGAGFDVDTARAGGMSSGLAGMQERASLAGGRLTIESNPGLGTTVAVELPLTSGNRSKE